MLPKSMLTDVEQKNTLPGVIFVADLLQEDPSDFPKHILPGTFDPFHEGHAQAKLIAETQLNEKVSLMLVEK